MKWQSRSGIRGAERGVTLVEVLIVVAIMALVATGVAVAAMGYYQSTRVKTAGMNAAGLREAVKGWWMKHDDETCPTVDELITDGILDEGSLRKDPWGGSWRIECTGFRVTVSSDGPDRKQGTADDIRVPPKST
jgi:general secretion pathway protein G